MAACCCSAVLEDGAMVRQAACRDGQGLGPDVGLLLNTLPGAQLAPTFIGAFVGLFMELGVHELLQQSDLPALYYKASAGPTILYSLNTCLLKRPTYSTRGEGEVVALGRYAEPKEETLQKAGCQKLAAGPERSLA